MLRKQSQYCQFVIDLKMENRYGLWKDQGFWKCNYFYRMAYSFFTITSLKSSLKFEKITVSLYFAAECIQAYNDLYIDRTFDSLTEFMKR